MRQWYLLEISPWPNSIQYQRQHRLRHLAGETLLVDLISEDSADLHNKPVLIRVAVEKDRDGNPRNVVKGFKPAATQPPKAPATPAKAEAKSSTPPWKKK